MGSPALQQSTLRSSCFPLWALAIVLPIVLTLSAAPAQDEPIAVSPTRDGIGYRVERFSFQYPLPHPDLPDASVLEDLIVGLTPVENGWIGAVEGSELLPVRLGSIGQEGPVLVYGSALAAINQSVRDFMESEYGLIGHLVTPDARQIAYQSTRADLRDKSETTLNILIWRAAVGDVRTVAHGERLNRELEESDDAISNVNRSEHLRLRERMRIKPGDLLTRERVDSDVFRLNRHPGRRADVAVAPSDTPGDVIVDYIITEPRPWNAYVSVSNTGTESTDNWRERFGFIHRQLTGRDDVLRLDYITSWFDETNAFLGSYTFDFGPRTRLKLSGRWSDYMARDVGLGFENFKGESYGFGAEAAVNVWQDGPRFVDLVSGVRYEHVNVENRLFLIEGSEEFLLPYAGVRYEKKTPLHNVFGEMLIESNWGSVVGTSRQDVTLLGRFGADENFTILRGQLSHSFYLDPYLDPKGFSGQKGEDEMTLAHEMLLSLRGQWAFHSRLAPNFEQVAGGAYSVRGYPESAAVGDDAIMLRAEYRYHFGRSTPISSETTTLLGRAFRGQRTRPYGSADWDLIMKGFVDVARVSPNDAPFFERAETLVGAGVGIEAQVRSNLTLKLDYGMALTPLGVGAGRSVDVGDTRLHFLAQFVF